MYIHITALPLTWKRSLVLSCASGAIAATVPNWQQKRHTRENAATTGGLGINFISLQYESMGWLRIMIGNALPLVALKNQIIPQNLLPHSPKG